MPEIKFERRYDTLTILNPLKGFTVERQQLEMRWDPLLRHISLYNPGIEDGLKSFIGEADWALLEQLAAESAGRCFFCPEGIELTARYPDTFIPGGRLTVGEATLFPNIFALAPYHAVIAVSRAHWLPPGGFTPRLIRDALNWPGSTMPPSLMSTTKLLMRPSMPTISFRLAQASCTHIFRR